MAEDLGLPVLVDRSAAEYLRQEITENVAEDEEHDCPGGISEFGAHAKEAEIEEKNREFVA